MRRLLLVVLAGAMLLCGGCVDGSGQVPQPSTRDCPEAVGGNNESPTLESIKVKFYTLNDDKAEGSYLVFRIVPPSSTLPIEIEDSRMNSRLGEGERFVDRSETPDYSAGPPWRESLTRSQLLDSQIIVSLQDYELGFPPQLDE